jgi:hypothetical protein
MAQRRERPPAQGTRNTIGLRFPDGSVRAMPIEAGRGRGGDSCCFCGESVDSDADRMQLSGHWIEDGRERIQEWDAHRTCLLERLHDAEPQSRS